MLLIANRQLTGDFGTVAPEEQFFCAEDEGNQLLQKGLARLAYRPVHYETKVITPEAPEVKPGGVLPFRDVPVIDAEPPALAALVAAVRAVPDVPAPGDPDRVERRGYRRSGAK
jgi:hypothetical protein